MLPLGHHVKSLLHSLILSLLLLYSFASKAEEHTNSAVQLEPVSLQLKWKHNYQFAGYYAAVEKGFYAEEGLDVTIQDLSSSKNVVAEVVEGQTNYAVGGSGIIVPYGQGAPIVALSAIFQHDALVFVAKESSGIISPYEMAGKRLMFNGTTTDDAPLTATIGYAGLNKQDLTLLPPSFRLDELINDEVDVMSVYLTDQTFELQQQGIRFNIINPQNYGFDFYGDILYTSQKELTEHPGRAERFRRASLKGWQYALNHPEELIQITKHKYNSESSIERLRFEARETHKLVAPGNLSIGFIDANRMTRVANIYNQQGLMPKLSELQIEKFIYKGNQRIKLTQQEQQWLLQHPTIKVGLDRDFAPYEWVDDNGVYQGLASDYFSLIEKQLGVTFEYVMDKPWHEIVELAKNGELDLLTCLNKSPERAQYLSFSDPYVKNPVVIINQKSNGYIGSLTKLAGKTVAIEKSYFTTEMLASDHPDIRLLEVDSTFDALKLVSVGDADAYVGDAAYADYAIRQSNLLNLQFSGQTPMQTGYRIGIHKTHPELHSIISKALNNIPLDVRDQLEQKWFGLQVSTGVATDTIIKGVLLTLFLMLFFAYWIYHLQTTSRALQQSEDKLRSILDASPVPHSLYNDKREIFYVNDAFTRTFGYELSDIPTISDWDKKAYPDPSYRSRINKRWATHFKRAKRSASHFDPIEMQVHCKDGSTRYVLATENDLINDKDDTHVVIFHDITEAKQQQDTMEMMAHYDVLTQLPNRNLFADRFNQAIAHSKRNNSLLAVVFVDLDDFKPINDKYGHSMGDKLLIEVANRIRSNIREEDTASRLGGDEFALLLSTIESPLQAEHFIARLHEALAAPFEIDGMSLTISASSGITVFPLDNADPDTLLRHADQAMYEAKLSGRNRYQFYDVSKDEQISQFHNQYQEIEQAFRTGHFELYYQPKINLRTGDILGAEALLRWIDPQKGLIPPLSFLPAIQGTKLEIEVGNWVVEQAFNQLNNWQRLGINISLSVNISSHHLQSSDFYHQLDKTLSAHPEIPSDLLELEILESSILSDISQISDVLNHCQNKLGIKISLDDFGTGYSSLSHLRHLPVNTVKIDQSFVKNILDEASDYSIVDGVISLTESFDRSVIAEGVETTEHGLMLMLMDCDHAQGYGIAKPMPEKEFIEWYFNYEPNLVWLELAQQNTTAQQKQVKQLHLATKHWLATLEDFIQMDIAQTKESELPTVDLDRALYRLWSKQVRKQHLFSHEWINQIDDYFEYLYETALELKKQKLAHPEQQFSIEALDATYELITAQLQEIDPELLT
jgi:diguanylate cyclase (GGDEF)-like protein/PAS domain S-box-containing protein